jgi:hypothetical protein
MDNADGGSRDAVIGDAIVEEGGGAGKIAGEPQGAPKAESAPPETVVTVRQRPFIVRWLAADLPFIAMLVLALGGLAFRLPINYWLVLIPVFAVISIVEGWRQSVDRHDRLGHVFRLAAIWCALLLSIYFILNLNSVKTGVLDSNSTAIAMMSLLALGTFVAGLQARVWRISGVGVVLFLAVPGYGWLDESLPLLAASFFVIVVLAAVFWWFGTGRRVVHPLTQ